MWWDKTDVTGEAGTAYTSGFSWVHVVQSLAFYVVICQSLFCSFILAIVLTSLRIMNSDYRFGIFRLFINRLMGSHPHSLNS
jgi:hypothetical protein